MIEAVKDLLKSNVVTYRVAKFLRDNIDPTERARIAARRRDEETFTKLVDSLVADKEDIFFIQVGSNDGVTNDPLRKYIVDLKWRGYLFEPVPFLFAKLQDLYRDYDRVTLLNAAVSPQRENLVFYTVKQNVHDLIDVSVPYWVSQLSSFKRENITNHLDGVLEPYIEELPVEVMSLDGLMERSRDKDLYLLHIDAEGYDYDVLSTLDLSKYAPKVLILEYVHLTDEIREKLLRELAALNYTVELFVHDLVAYR